MNQARAQESEGFATTDPAVSNQTHILIKPQKCWEPVMSRNSSIYLLQMRDMERFLSAHLRVAGNMSMYVYTFFYKQSHFRVEPPVFIKISKMRLKVARKYFQNRGSGLKVAKFLTILVSNVRKIRENLRLKSC